MSLKNLIIYSVGKSSILKILESSFLNAAIFLEPVDCWCNLKWKGKTFNPLEDYYNMKTPFELQMYIQSSFIRHLYNTYENAKNNGKEILFTERRMMSSIEIFASLSLSKGELSEKEYAILEYNMQTYKILLPHLFEYDIVFYIFSTPETCHKHIGHRGRTEESIISLKYLNELEQKYQDWYNVVNSNNLIRVKQINANNNNINSVALNIIKEALEFGL